MYTQREITKIVRNAIPNRNFVGFKKRLKLAKKSGGAFKNVPPRILIVLFAARSGSTYAGRLLSQTEYFNNVREIFNHSMLEKARERLGEEDHGAAARWLVSRDATEHALGFECGTAGMVGACVTGFLRRYMDRITFIRLRRRDVVAQAISVAKVHLSGRYHSTQPQTKKVTLEDYDRDTISKNIDMIYRINESLAAIPPQLGKQAPMFLYEDICEDPLGFVNEVLKLMDLPPHEGAIGDTGVKVLRDDISRQWRDRYVAHV